jgi:hypothetical protein
MAFTLDNGNLPPAPTGGHKDKNGNAPVLEQTRQRELMKLVNNLALVTMNTTLNERNLQCVRLARAKMSKVKGNQPGNW